MFLPIRSLLWILRATGCSVVLCASAAGARAEDLPDPDAVETPREVKGHGGEVYCVAFAPDSGHVASGSFDRTARIWRVKDGAPRVAFAGHGGKVMACGFSKDGKRFATGGQDKVVRVWDVPALAAAEPAPSDLKPALELKGHESYVQGLEFSPDGKWLASASGDKSVRVWSLADGKEAKKLDGHGASVYAVAFAPSGALLASGGSDKTVRLWNPVEGKEAKTIADAHEEAVLALAFVADGKELVSAGFDLKLKRWDLESAKVITVYAGHRGWPCGVGVDPSGATLVSADYGGHIVEWDLAAGAARSHRRVARPLYSMALSPDGGTVALAARGNVVLLVPAKAP